MSVRPSNKKALALNITGYHRHILLCTGPKCCSEEQGLQLWAYLKASLDRLGLANTPGAPVFRSKVGCLRICSDGPIAVVYPEGAWYRLLDEDAIDRIIKEHIIDGHIVQDYLLAVNEGQSRKDR